MPIRQWVAHGAAITLSPGVDAAVCAVLAIPRRPAKRLAVIENSGSMNVLCTDKTGTITEAVVTLQAVNPLVGQKLAVAHAQGATAMMASCIIAAQLVMVPIALLVGPRPIPGVASVSSWSASPSCRSVPCSTRSPITARG